MHLQVIKDTTGSIGQRTQYHPINVPGKGVSIPYTLLKHTLKGLFVNIYAHIYSLLYTKSQTKKTYTKASLTVKEFSSSKHSKDLAAGLHYLMIWFDSARISLHRTEYEVKQEK